MNDDLYRLQARLDRLESERKNYIVFEQHNSAPQRVVDGLLIYADGTNWNPGSGKGLYQYRGGAWVFIA